MDARNDADIWPEHMSNKYNEFMMAALFDLTEHRSFTSLYTVHQKHARFIKMFVNSDFRMSFSVLSVILLAQLVNDGYFYLNVYTSFKRLF